MIATVVAKRRSTISKRADTTVQTPPSKRPRQEAEPKHDALRPQKRVKTLAKKEEREIHVISSQTTQATASDAPSVAPIAQDLQEQQPTPIGRASQVSPTSVTVEQLLPRPSPKQLNHLLLRRARKSQSRRQSSHLFRRRLLHRSRGHPHNVQNERQSFWRRYERF